MLELLYNYFRAPKCITSNCVSLIPVAKLYIFVLSMVSISVVGQTTNYIGVVYMDTVIMDLSLKLVHNEDSVSGFSVMNQKTTIESKSDLRGQFDPDSKTYLIKEINAVNDSLVEDSNTYCLLEMTLLKSKNKLSGTFVGHDSEGHLCAEGTLEMNELNHLKKKLKFIEKKIAKASKNPIIKVLSKDDNYTIRTKNKEVKFSIWDAGVEDGDCISLHANTTSLLDNYEIKTKKEKISYTLNKGENTFVLTAENTGKYPPNTAIIEITAKKQSYQFKYELKKEEKIMFTITKDK